MGGRSICGRCSWGLSLSCLHGSRRIHLHFPLEPVATGPSLLRSGGNWHRYTCPIRQRLWAAGGLQPIVPCLLKLPGRQALIAMKMGEIRRTSYRVLYLFRARELTDYNTDCHTLIPGPTRLADPNRVWGTRPCTGTLCLIFFFKPNWYQWVWPTSYNIIKISYTFLESHLQIQNCTFTFTIRARNLL